MSEQTIHLTVEVDHGPALRAALDVLDLVIDTLPHLPDSRQRQELIRRAQSLTEICVNGLRRQQAGVEAGISNDHP